MSQTTSTSTVGAAGLASIPLDQRITAASIDWRSGAFADLADVGKAWLLTPPGYKQLSDLVKDIDDRDDALLEERIVAAAKAWEAGTFKHLTHVSRAWGFDAAGYLKLRRRVMGHSCKRGHAGYNCKLNAAQDKALSEWAEAEVAKLGGEKLDVGAVLARANDILKETSDKSPVNRRWAREWMRRKEYLPKKGKLGAPVEVLEESSSSPQPPT